MECNDGPDRRHAGFHGRGGPWLAGCCRAPTRIFGRQGDAGHCHARGQAGHAPPAPSTRALHLTEFGETYLATCRQVLSTLDAAERGAAAEQEQPSGLLTVTAPLRFGQLHVRPILDAFLDANPAVQARLLLLDRIANLVGGGNRCCSPGGDLPDSRLVAARLGEVRRVLCASPGYIKRCGVPQSPAKLREHACIMERDGADTEFWRFGSKRGKSLLSIAVRPRLRVNSAAAAVESAVAGHGIARVMSYQAAVCRQAPAKLVILLPKYEPPTIPVSLVVPSARSEDAEANGPSSNLQCRSCATGSPRQRRKSAAPRPAQDNWTCFQDPDRCFTNCSSAGRPSCHNR